MTKDEAEALVRALATNNARHLFTRGIDLIKADYPEILLPVAKTATRQFPDDPRVHQLLGLAARAVGESHEALEAFSRAAQLAPNDALIAHSHARVALEAGRPSSGLFERARLLSPNDGAVLLGRSAARVQEGNATLAIEELEDILQSNPLWTDGHRAAAQIRAQEGLELDATLRAAIALHPSQPDLRRLHISLLLEARDLPAADRAAIDAFKMLGDQPWLTFLAAHIASERGDLIAADRLFSKTPVPSTPEDVSLLARHAIRARRPEVAVGLLEQWIEQDRNHLLWPYLSLAWRMTGDRRWHWLEGDERLVGVYDLAERFDNLDGLAEHLRALHVAREAPLDQSVRGGTQTDGNLLLRDEPQIRALRALLLETVSRHVAQLPDHAEGHPTLPRQRECQRISGSWSVRLKDSGFHSDHVHSQGWLSSALYVSLPDSLSSPGKDSSHEGWLSLGECRDLLPELEPIRLIEPRPGRLVLFPSTMWHGTRAFPAGERMTVAFDIALPRQS
ncbi:putative 2OG-Fe(II) oxygenase [Erythrobacter mangrovi]|uniref:Uncharacterized protein n=1 Tax=Erythrobacter mangrovi TaxID=2739433 RepID=A0A7D3XPW7_9SPHN|nr:putative 2OG-Fe(II) oxygenase [Erythrobacter mangrovi]QKG70191.1 hypothetical protein HQR01_01725 [Erythrobacter mangrovi]